jgi:hypothetical protein
MADLASILSQVGKLGFTNGSWHSHSHDMTSKWQSQDSKAGPPHLGL